MAEYRIRKGEREFVAQKLETLHELVRRGLVSPSDEVSVDGAPYVSVREVQEADGTVDPWRHWNDAREGSGDSGVLSDFLDELSPSPSSRSVPIADPPPGPTTDEVPDLPVESVEFTAVEPEPPPMEVEPDEPLAEVETPDLVPEPEPPAAEPEPPAAEPPAPEPERPRHHLRLVEPEADAPVSFADWVDRRGGSGTEGVLKDFGRVDDGVVLHGRRRRGPNWWRTVGILVLAVVVIALWHTWVKTIALTDYPTEAELIAQVQGDGPALPSIEPVTASPDTTPPTARDWENRLRSKIAGDIIQFGNTDQLENAIFQELFNQRIQPQSVEVETLRIQGSGDFQRDRPIEAKVRVTLAAPPAGGDITANIHERLPIVWLVLAKYSIQGKVTFPEVTTHFGEPSVYDDVREGRRLVALMNGRVTATMLLLESQ